MLEVQALPVETRVVLRSLHSEDELRPSTAGSTGVKRNITIAGVTAEAREVLEQFLRRSLSDVNQRGRPGGLQRQPLTAIIEHDQIFSSQEKLNGNQSNGRSSPTRSHQYVSRAVMNGAVEVNSNFDSGAHNRHSRDHFSADDSLDEPIARFQELPRKMTKGELAISRMLAEPELSDITDSEEELDKNNDVPKKKKKSVFRRARERLQATFSRQTDRKKSPTAENDKSAKKDGRHAPFASFRHKSKKAERIQEEVRGSNGHVGVNKQRKSDTRDDVQQRPASASDLPKSKGLFASLQRKMSSRRLKRSQSKGKMCHCILYV